MEKKTIKKLFRRSGISVLLIALLFTFASTSTMATVSTRNTTAITPIIGGETEVYTVTEFQKAAADARVTKITLKDNLIFTDHQILERKTESDLTIDGAYMYAIYAGRSGNLLAPLDPTGNMSFEFKNFKSVTFTRIGLGGEAFGAFAYSLRPMTITFDNVVFTGPALAYIRAGVASQGIGRIVIRDSVIDLRKRIPDSADLSRAWYDFPSNAAQIGYGEIVLSGTVHIEKELPGGGRETDNEPVFKFLEKSAKLIVDPGAKVTVLNKSTATNSTGHTGLLQATCCWSALATRTLCLNHDLQFIVGEGADFTYTGSDGIINEGVGLTNFTVKENARVNMEVSIPYDTTVRNKTRVNRGSYLNTIDFNIMKNAEVNVTVKNDTRFSREAVVGVEHLTVNENATFRVVSPDNKTAENTLRFHGRNPSMYLDRPYEVLLYNGKPYDSRGETRAIAAGQNGDCCYLLVNCFHAASADIKFTFNGVSMNTWSDKDNNIPVDRSSLAVSTEKATTWSTGVAGEEYSFKADLSKSNMSLVKPEFSKATVRGFSSSSGTPIASSELKTFADKRIVQFIGTAEVKRPILKISHIVVTGSRLTSDLTTLSEVELEGNGVDPIVYEFNPDRYRNNLISLLNYRFNAYEKADYTGLYNVGTFDNLSEFASINTDDPTNYVLTVYPNDFGQYPAVNLYYAQHTKTYGDDPDYWYKSGV